MKTTGTRIVTKLENNQRREIDQAIVSLTEAEEIFPPTLISGETLRQAEFASAFPHLLVGACPAKHPEQDPFTLFEENNLQSPDFFLNPAACYHTYEYLAGKTLEEPVVLTLKARCFRNEDREIQPGRRQVEFEMRELVYFGTTDWIAHQTQTMMSRMQRLADSLWGFDTLWHAATDPFFLPRASGKAYMQKLTGAKRELCLPGGLAIASVNRHGTFFGERFSISDSHGHPVETACAAFGIDRIQHELNQSNNQKQDDKTITCFAG